MHTHLVCKWLIYNVSRCGAVETNIVFNGAMAIRLITILGQYFIRSLTELRNAMSISVDNVNATEVIKVILSLNSVIIIPI